MAGLPEVWATDLQEFRGEPGFPLETVLALEAEHTQQMLSKLNLTSCGSCVFYCLAESNSN